MADGGTLFLDEIGDMPLELQPKLLRALQEREFERFGQHAGRSGSTCGVVAATNQDLGELVTQEAVSGRPVLSIECHSNLPAPAA